MSNLYRRKLLLAALCLTAGALLTIAGTNVRRSRMKHPKSGAEITIPGPEGKGALLVSGWRVTPAGRTRTFGDMMLSAAVSPDGKTLAVTNSGYGDHGLRIFDLQSEKEIASFPLDRSWSGLVWAPDGRRIYVSGGISNVRSDVLVFERWDERGWAEGGGRSLLGAKKEQTAVAALELSPNGSTLYALNNSDGHLYVSDTFSGRGLARVPVGDHPIACKRSRDGSRLYVASLGSAEVAVVDVSKPEEARVVTRIPTEPHPNDLALSRDGRLFVSCGNTDSIVVIDLPTQKRIETVKTSLTPNSPYGSTPNSLAVSPDQSRLYVANADNNNVAVIDISKRGESRVSGFIPSGWYPTLVAVTADGRKLIIGSGKGLATGPNGVQRPIHPDAAVGFQHHGRRLAGLLSFIDTPSKAVLADYTNQVYANTPYRDALLKEATASAKSVIPTSVGSESPIKHVLYIIKENRTYDQVLGDLPQGNGDPSLTLFGREVTPNQHALSEQFVLLDNLYCSGEVSQDGHPWSTSAYATDFAQRSWTLGYSRHGRTVFTGGIGEQTSPYIWEAAAEKGLRVRAYNYRGRRGLDKIQSDRFAGRAAPNALPRRRDYQLADLFIEEFHELEKRNEVPNFMIMSLGENHTQGTTPGAFTPKASVASNDLALGRIVEAISQSSLWGKFAIFVIEDDAQNGPDHIDSHRTVGSVISPYVRRKVVDSTMYSTMSMLRTIGLLLGLKPLTQHDASATPMFHSFMETPDASGYKALPARIDLQARNAPDAYGAAQSARLDWSAYDRTDEQALNEILWHSIKGAHTPMPPPVRRALPVLRGGSLTIAD